MLNLNRHEEYHLSTNNGPTRYYLVVYLDRKATSLEARYLYQYFTGRSKNGAFGSHFHTLENAGGDLTQYFQQIRMHVDSIQEYATGTLDDRHAVLIDYGDIGPSVGVMQVMKRLKDDVGQHFANVAPEDDVKVTGVDVLAVSQSYNRIVS